MHHDEAAHLAEFMLRFRRIRPDALPSGLFDETGWEFLLELFIADAQGRRLTGRELCERSGSTSQTSGLWLKHLSREELVVGDGDGELDDTLTLSPKGLHQLETLLEKAGELRRELLAS